MSQQEDPGIHTLPITVDYSGQDVTFTPTLVETGRGLVLIDVGPEDVVDYLRTHIESLEYDLSDVWLVILTHHDADHAGGLAELLERTDAVVATHRDEAPFVTGDRDPIKGSADGDRYPPVTVDLELSGGVRIPTLAGPMEVLETPGHAPGHVSLYFPDGNLLVAGDALVADGGGDGTDGDDRLFGPKPEFTPDVERALESVADLADLEIDHVVCYHGGYVDSGTERIRELAEHADE